MENEEIRSKKQKFGVFVGLISLILIVVVAGLIWRNGRNGQPSGQTNYVIPGAPYFGIFNHKGDLGAEPLYDTDAAAATIMEYWNPGENDLGLTRHSYLLWRESAKTAENKPWLKNYLEKKGYYF